MIVLKYQDKITMKASQNGVVKIKLAIDKKCIEEEIMPWYDTFSHCG